GRINLPDSGATIANISLACRKSGPSIVNCQLSIVNSPSHIPTWLGYRSKQEFKTPTAGVRPRTRGPDTAVIRVES
ncbi:MAG: hypothetical protein MUO33_06075, partial [Sedimentisphaerales bacterium]|nr:hypothetical protein [Sedimentisphaerales bacterium]